MAGLDIVLRSKKVSRHEGRLRSFCSVEGAVVGVKIDGARPLEIVVLTVEGHDGLLSDDRIPTLYLLM